MPGDGGCSGSSTLAWRAASTVAGQRRCGATLGDPGGPRGSPGPDFPRLVAVCSYAGQYRHPATIRAFSGHMTRSWNTSSRICLRSLMSSRAAMGMKPRGRLNRAAVGTG